MTVAFSPQGLDEALDALAAHPGAVPVAGCTDFLVAVQSGKRAAPPAVVDLTRVPELQGVRVDNGWLDIGAASTFWQLRHDPLVRRHAPILAEIAATIGAWQIQARATLGGNLANASPAGDSLPVLLALDAELVVASAGGQRTIPYAEFHRGYRVTALEPGEVIVRIRVPVHPTRRQLVRKVGTRQAQAIAIVTVAACATIEGGRMRNARLAAASVAPVPLRLRAAEAACEGQPADEATAQRAGAEAAREVTPIDDVRATAAYRRWVVERVVRRLVSKLGSLPGSEAS